MNNQGMRVSNAENLSSPYYTAATQSDYRYNAMYQLPYLDPLCLQLVSDPRIMMNWGRYFYDWDPIVHAAINKMAVYPVIFGCRLI